jgi:hypothetical protein
MTRLLFSIFTVLIILTIPITTHAVDCKVDRCATCDQCGYCWESGQVPGDWENCRKCLYPTADSDPLSYATLQIDSATNQPPAPASGRWYTMIGCVNTSSNFDEKGAAGDVIEIVLTRLVFSIVGGIAFLYLIYGSFILITSQSSPEKLNYGKRIIYGAIIGVVFSLTSILLINLIASGILKIPGFG